MANRKKNEYKRYKESERIWAYGLIADAAVGVLYLLMAGLGVVWLKWILAIAAVLLSAAGLASLYLTGELRRHRSLYLTAGYAAVAVVILFSLILNYPSPNELVDTINNAVG